ncbi:helix-turn-helix transcriptional regulator [Kitasatospora sp. NPDC056651]|uniref:helix-turn-helix transcriptional regulator n=1 Tax=Kitasatospora sp. NPDC056651 TaxID=3345892 RepID=UPI0036CF4C3B
MTAPGPGARLLPAVHEPRVLRCGHYIAEKVSRHQALVLSHLVTGLNAIEIADAVNSLPERSGGAAVTPDRVREYLNSLRVKVRARTWVQMVDTACRMKLLLPPRTELEEQLPETVVHTLQLSVDGCTNQQIAAMRSISHNTAGKHLETIRYLTGTRSNPAAVFRLHGVVPGVLDSTCPMCPTGPANPLPPGQSR